MLLNNHSSLKSTLRADVSQTVPTLKEQFAAFHSANMKSKARMYPSSSCKLPISDWSMLCSMTGTTWVTNNQSEITKNTRWREASTKKHVIISPGLYKNTHSEKFKSRKNENKCFIISERSAEWECCFLRAPSSLTVEHGSFLLKTHSTGNEGSLKSNMSDSAAQLIPDFKCHQPIRAWEECQCSWCLSGFNLIRHIINTLKVSANK